MDVGSRFQLVCSIRGTDNTVGGLDWFRDGSRLETSSAGGISIMNRFSADTGTLTSILVINRARLSDSGTYVCRGADNAVRQLKILVLNTGKSLISTRVCYFCFFYLFHASKGSVFAEFKYIYLLQLVLNAVWWL